MDAMSVSIHGEKAAQSQQPKPINFGTLPLSKRTAHVEGSQSEQ